MSEPWESDPIAAKMNPDAPWESDPAPASWWKTLKAIPGTTLGQTVKSVGGTIQAVGEEDPAKVMAGIESERGGGPLRYTPTPMEERTGNVVAKTGADIADLGGEQIKEAHPGDMNYWQRAVLSGTSSALSQIPALTASVLMRNPAPAVASAAVMTGGSTYAENREKNIGPDRAAAHAAVDATAEGAFEMIPAKFLVDNISQPILKLMWGTLAREVPTEVLTTAVQSANAKFSTRPDMTWKEYGQDLLDTVGATMVAAPMTGATGGGVHIAQGLGNQPPLNLPKINALDLRTAVEKDTGMIIPDNPPQQFDQPTTIPDSAGQDQIQALIASLDADTLDDATVAKSQETVKRYEEMKKANPQAEISWMGYATAPDKLQEDSGELGASAKQTANAKNYVNPNTGDRRDRPFLYGPEGSEGLTMRNVAMQPATYTLGQATEDRPAEYLKAVHDTVEQWREKYMPQATMVISNEELFTDSALGSHYLVLPGQHLIVPAVLRSPSKGLGAFNMNTQASAFYNLTHEFGHGLIKERFLEGVDPQVAMAVVRESEVGLVAQDKIGLLPAPQQAVIREYNAIKEAIANNQMSAEQFINTWMSPGKLGRNFLGDLKVQPTDNAMDVVKAVVARASKRANINDDSKIKDMREKLTRDYLSLDEYLAEQTARYAYKSNWDKTSPLGQFFKGALDSLRTFFAGLKKAQQIAPGTAFQEWVDGLSKSDRPLTQADRVTEGKKKGAAPAKPEGKVVPATRKTKQAAPKKKVETVQHNVETSTVEGKQLKGRILLTELVRTGVFESVKSDEFKEMMGYLKTEDWSEFVDAYKRHAGKNIKLQIDPDAASSGHVGIKTDIKALIEVFGLNMYTGDVSDVLVKELVQNSFDAVKSMIFNKKLTSGTIDVKIDQDNHSITVSDDGVGMDKETLLKAFLTYPGTSKPDLPMEQRSGGLGQAKQLLLFTPESIHVESIKNGQKITLDATPNQLLEGSANLNTTPVDKATPSGTTVTVRLPAQVSRQGEMTPVELPLFKSAYKILENPPLFPGVNVTFRTVEGGIDFQVNEIQSLLKTHKLFKKVQTEWGYVDIYTGETKTGEYAPYYAKHRILSSGAWQFDTEIKMMTGEKLPMDLIFDIHSSVPGQHGAYPFTPNRQELREHSRKQLTKAIDAVIEEYYKELLRKHVAAYTNVQIINDNGSFIKPQFTVSEGANKVPVVSFVRGVVPPSFYFNSTNKDYLRVPNANLYITELAAVFRDFVKLYTENHDSKGNQYSVGIGFDRGTQKGTNSSGWGGLHFKKPYHSLWLNPVYMDEAIDPASAAAAATHVMMHEAMHINKNGHDAGAFYELATMYAHLDGDHQLHQIKSRLENIFAKYWEAHSAIKALYDATDTTTVGDSIKGDAAQRVRDIDAIEAARSNVSPGGERAGGDADSRGPWRNTSYELDVSEHPEQRPFLNGLKNFLGDYPRLRRAMRSVTNAVYHVTELQQLSHLNPDIDELAMMNEKNGEYNRYKSRLQAQADAVLTEWNSLGKENFGKLNKFLFAEVEAKELWWDLAKTQVVREGRPATWYEYRPGQKTVEKALEFGLDEGLTSLALNVKNTLLSQLNEAEFALLNLLGKRYANAGQEVLTAAFIPVKRHIHELRKQAFFPQGRFGNRMLIVEKKKADGVGWEIVWREHFEDPLKWEQAWKKAISEADGVETRVRKEELSDQHYVLMALPTDFVDMAASELGLSDDQLEILMNILQPVKRDRVLGAYDQQRLGIKGYSTDAMRSFANFTWHNSNLLAKLIYRADFNWAIRSVGMRLRDAKYSVDPQSLRNVDRLQHIKTYMEKTRDYIMAPPNEAQMLRAAVSIGYLGLNVKTALLNTYGLITTWSDLTTRLGQVEGNKLFMKASLGTFKSLKLTNLNERREGNYLSPEHQQALDKAIEEGVLSQSYAYHLAGAANAGNLYRLPARQALGRGGQLAIDAAMYVFRLTELSTRRASFLAEFEAARKKPNVSFEDAYQEAVTRTNKLQNDYSLGNRVPFMRGIKAGNENPVGKIFEPVVPLMTVFMSFAQHMAFHAYGGYELGEHRMAKQLGETPRTIWGGYTMKIWIITLLLAGYEGLPGAENLLDLLEIAWRKWGGAKPVRQELREFVQELDVDPQLAARGFGHNMGGFDISRSVGFGRIVPGTDVLAHPRNSMAEQLGVLALDLAGPTGGFIKFGLDAIGSKKGKAETFEHLPGGAGNIYTAYRWSQNGVRAPTGARVTFDLETGQLRNLTADEILGKALGFNPTVVSQNREIRFSQYDRKVYWQTRRQGLIETLWTAHWQKDREAEADAKKAIVEYNAGVPSEYRQLKLTGAEVAKSLQARERIKRFDEKQTSPQRKYRPLYEDVSGSYDHP